MMRSTDPSHQDELPQRATPPVAPSWWFARDPTSLVGRESLVDELVDTLSNPHTRLVTLVGPGGVGKTRLAVHLAWWYAELPGRVAVVDLSGVDAPEELVPALASSLSIRIGTETPEHAVASSFSTERSLLVLDNFEQLLAARSRVIDLLGRCPNLQILVTSRLRLRVRGEIVVEVPPLGVTDDPSGDVSRTLLPAPSVRLFEQVARAADHRFRLDPSNVGDVSSICRAVGGLPLAIELAAARASTLSPALLARQLERGSTLHALTEGAVDLPARQRDLRSSIRWSHDLLGPRAQQVLRLLVHFSGWWTIEELHEVATLAGSASEVDVLDAVSTLAEAHFIEVDRGGPVALFRLQRLFREFVRELPDTDGTDDIARGLAAHRSALLRLAGAATLCLEDNAPLGSHARGSIEQYLATLTRREDDLIAAVNECLAVGAGHDAATLMTALVELWAHRGNLTARSGLLQRVIESSARTGASRESLLRLETWILVDRIESAGPQVDAAHAARELDDAVDAARALGDPQLRLRMLEHSVGAARIIGHYDQAVRHADEALDLARREDAGRAVARFELWAAMLAEQQGRRADAVAQGTSALEHAQQLGDRAVAAMAGNLLRQLGATLPADAVDTSSGHRPNESLDDLPSDRTKVVVLADRAASALAEGDVVSSAQACAAGVRAAVALGSPIAARVVMSISVGLCARTGRTESAAAIHGGLAHDLAVLKRSMPPRHAAAYDRTIESVQRALGPDAFAEAVRLGSGWSWPELLDTALRIVDEIGRQQELDEPADAPTLSNREKQVLTLLAAGLSNKQIAAELGVSVKTVMHHTVNIYRKLQVRGRVEAITLALRTGLVETSSSDAPGR